MSVSMVSNAIAFENYGYDNSDQYQNYPMDMDNEYEDGQYRPYENNNYQSDYQSYGEDRDKSNNNNLIKKIKCNNINNNLNEVNITIGNGDPTGLGAALFQEDSANTNGYGERNGNGDFDLDCINNNNNEGVEGQQGPIGPEGPEGPPGITQLNNDTTYTVRTPINVTQDDDAIGEGFARCESGDFAISGGYVLNNTSPKAVEFFTVTDEPLYDAWHVRTFSNFGGVDVGGTVIVKCFDNPPLNTLTAASAVSTFQQPEDSLTVSQGVHNSPKLTTLEKQPVDSPDLTAMKKITKLKTQWLNQLP